jgi:hypothetical protein
MRRTIVAAALVATILMIEIPPPIAAMPVATPARLGIATTEHEDALRLAVWHRHYWHRHYWHRHYWHHHYWRWHFPHFWLPPWGGPHWGWRHHHRNHHPAAPSIKEKAPDKPAEPAPPAPEGQTNP